MMVSRFRARALAGLVIGIATLSACQALLDTGRDDLRDGDAGSAGDASSDDGASPPIEASANDGPSPNDASADAPPSFACPSLFVSNTRCADFEDETKPAGTFDKVEKYSSVVNVTRLDGGASVLEVTTGPDPADAGGAYGYLAFDLADAGSLRCDLDFQLLASSSDKADPLTLVTFYVEEGSNFDAALLTLDADGTAAVRTKTGVPGTSAVYNAGWNHAALKFATGVLGTPSSVSGEMNGRPLGPLPLPSGFFAAHARVGPDHAAAGWHLFLDNFLCTYAL